MATSDLPPGFYGYGVSTPPEVALLVLPGAEFRQLTSFRYIDKSGEEWPVPASDDETTDLASVPPWLWGMIASYGRQLYPALLHDRLNKQALTKPKAVGYELRRKADLQFLDTLRIQGVGPLRARTFVAAVTIQRKWKYGQAFRAFLMGAQVLLAFAAFWAMIITLSPLIRDAVMRGVHLVVTTVPAPPWRDSFFEAYLLTPLIYAAVWLLLMFVVSAIQVPDYSRALVGSFVAPLYILVLLVTGVAAFLVWLPDRPALAREAKARGDIHTPGPFPTWV